MPPTIYTIKSTLEKLLKKRAVLLYIFEFTICYIDLQKDQDIQCI